MDSAREVDLCHWIDSSESFAERIVAFACVEGIFFFSFWSSPASPSPTNSSLATSGFTFARLNSIVRDAVRGFDEPGYNCESPKQKVLCNTVLRYWFSVVDKIGSLYQITQDSIPVVIVDDSRPLYQSVNEGYLRYTQFRAVQHVTSAALSVLSTQILKDGMQHVGKLICSNWGARMDSEPKRWRLQADVLYDIGTVLEILSPLCPHLFLEMAGLGNLAKRKSAVSSATQRNAGNVRVGRDVHKVIKSSRLIELKQVFHKEKFLLNFGNKCVDMVLEQDASGEDAFRGWLVAAYAAEVESSSNELSANVLHEAYEKMDGVFPVFLKELQNKEWHTDRFLDGTGSRFAF
ncbi:Protein root UVB sensitive 2, chloroplastic, partial [Mucuna pruriens]